MAKRGIVVNLKDYFPATDMANIYLSNSFRARGLFKEQGHLMRFLAIMFFPLIGYMNKKSKIKSYFLMAIFLFMMFYTASAALALFLMVSITYLVVLLKKNAHKVIGWCAILLLGSVAVLFLSHRVELLNNIVRALVEGVTEIVVTTGSNGGRLQGMKCALEIIKQYPIFGCGWNCITMVMVKLGYYGNMVLGSYSGLLSLIAEVGVFGFFYIYFIISKGIYFIKQNHNVANVQIGIALFMYLLVFISTDYSIDASVSVLISLSLIQYYESINTINERGSI
jgi:hypothetical protein